MPLPVLQTLRLTLRPMGVADRAALIDALNDWDVTRWLSVVPYPYTEADADWWLAECAADRAQVFAIADTDGLCGAIGISGHDVGYWLARRVWAKGYMTEAGRAVFAWHFAQSNADLTSGYFDGNDRSAAVLRKLGFLDCGPKSIDSPERGGTIPGRAMRLSHADWAALNV